MLTKLRAKLKGWKTVIVNGVLGVSGLLVYFTDQLQTIDWSKVLTPPTVGWLMIGLAVAGIILRAVTTNAIGQK